MLLTPNAGLALTTYHLRTSALAHTRTCSILFVYCSCIPIHCCRTCQSSSTTTVPRILALLHLCYSVDHPPPAVHLITLVSAGALVLLIVEITYIPNHI